MLLLCVLQCVSDKRGTAATQKQCVLTQGSTKAAYAVS